MRLSLLAPLLLGIAALGGCTCAETVKQTRFACTDTSECLPDFVCRGGECRAQDIPSGTCFEGETKPCAQASCSSACGPDGGFLACAPSDGGPFETNPLNCGACGRQCSNRLGSSLTCIDGRCSCINDFDCPSGDVCGPGFVCVMNTDVCAKVVCDGGAVCRDGACAPVGCSAGCKAGEVCDSSSSTCRPILPCRLPTACDGGICEGPVQPDGELCNDGVGCTASDVCTFGACRGTAYTCPAPTQCQQTVSCAGDGGCDIVPMPDGTSCDDGVSCTAADSCQAGVCTGTTYACNPDQCAATSVCAGDGGCLTTPRNIGSVCDDGQACSFDDVCTDGGTCAGTTYSCPGVTDCKQAGVCLGDGGCDVVNKANGTVCDDGQGCTATDVCTNGSCAGTPVTSYLDADNDGRGALATTQQVCPLNTGYVLDGGDCNDGSNFVSETVPAALDVDQDGVTAATALDPAACVGDTSTVGGRTYYRSSSGSYSYLLTASPSADCNDADPDVFVSRTNLILDVDHDGYSSGTAAATCSGTSQVFNGRTYYANASGAFVYLDASAALGGGDCNDADADVFTTMSVARDTDRDGFTTTTTLSSQCVGASSVVNTRTYFNDSAGAATWIATASAAADCNDTNATITGTTTYYVDADADTFGAGTGTPRCTAVAGEVLNNTDCNDADPDVFTTRTVATDADHDSFTTALTTSSQCTGASSVVNTRTYFNDVSGLATWIATASATIDCDDGSATVFPRTYYRDVDGDGFGAGAGQVQCPQQSGWVTNNTDCNDASNNVYQSMLFLYDDTDQDGWTTGTVSSTTCVGSTTTVGGRTYYRGTAGTFIYVTNSLGTDCNLTNGALFISLNNVVVDNDRDGYPNSITDQSGVCAGATTTVSGRTYYANGTGGYWMPRTDCINRQGSNCALPIDCYDGNANAIPGQLSYFTTQRGDGSFDYDCSGGVNANSGAAYCSATAAGTQSYTDGSCSVPGPVVTQCTPAAFSLPGACGKQTQGAAINYLDSTPACVGGLQAGATTIGCR